MEQARRGDLDTRAEALTAHRVWIAKAAAGSTDDPSDMAAAGALLDAEQGFALAHAFTAPQSAPRHVPEGKIVEEVDPRSRTFQTNTRG